MKRRPPQIGRERPRRRLDLVPARGSLAQADTRALAVGVFSDVHPSGAARAIDLSLNGAIRTLWRRRAFPGRAGEVFILPCARSTLRADLVAIVGLGAFDAFGASAIELAAENLARTLAAGGIDELATVLWGGGSGRRPAAILGPMLAGFLRGLRGADPAGRFRRLVLCETDSQRYRGLAREARALAARPILEEMDLSLTEERLPEAPVASTESTAAQTAEAPAPAAADPLYLLLSTEGADARRIPVHSSLLSAGGKATVVSGTREVSRDDWDALAGRVAADPLTDSVLEALGDATARTLLSEEVRELLAAFPDRHLVVVHDTLASQVPWEALRIAGRRAFTPALAGGLTRRFRAEKLSVAKWLEERRLGGTFDLLLVVNPTQDLAGAEAEGERIARLVGDGPGGEGRVRIERLDGARATRRRVRDALGSGAFDAVHYAGHAFFDAADPGRSGILCAGREVLSGVDLAGLSSLPALVFFNACESGRVRAADGRRPSRGSRRGGRAAAPGDKAASRSYRQRIIESSGVAEAFMRGGLANYLGTYWPVGDDAALAFAESFYARLLDGDAIGAAVLAGRRRVRELRSPDWADYILYGDQDFSLKIG
jgi:hypothetical protein